MELSNVVRYLINLWFSKERVHPVDRKALSELAGSRSSHGELRCRAGSRHIQQSKFRRSSDKSCSTLSRTHKSVRDMSSFASLFTLEAIFHSIHVSLILPNEHRRVANEYLVSMFPP